MRNKSKRTVCALLAVFTCMAMGPLFARDKTVGQKVDQAVEKAERAERTVEDKAKELAHDAKDKAEELAHNAKDKAEEIHDKAKEKAHEGIDHL